MSTLAYALELGKTRWFWFASGLGVALFIAATGIPNLLRSRDAVEHATIMSREVAESAYQPALMRTKSVLAVSQSGASKAQSVYPSAGAEAGRKIVRSSSLEMVVRHPSEAADQITAAAENLGGYLVSEQGGDAESTAATLTIRVPATRFEEARAEIRKLGLRVESERIDAQNVTGRYVDQDASLHNLRAEEAQYLAILKQARTVKDMLAVSEKLSEVRGQIEVQQAEFDSLSHQIETVAIAISLRAEQEAQVFGLNWRPLHQLKLALREGLQSLVNYVQAMFTILFYLPAILMWVATIVLTLFAGSKMVKWIAKRWPWRPTALPEQR